MAVASGLTGLLSVDGSTAFQMVRNFRMNPTANNAKSAMSNSGGAEIVTKGLTDFSGSFDFYGVSPFGSILPGAAVTFYGQNGTDEINVPVMIETLTIKWDAEGGGVINGSCTFGGNGAITYTNSITSLTNTVLPVMSSAVGIGASWAPQPAGGVLASYAAIPDIRTMELRVSTSNKDYGSSSQTYRKRVKGVLKASISLSLYESAYSYYTTTASVLSPGSQGGIKMFTDATHFYLLTYPRVASIGIDNDVEGGAPISGTINLDWSAYSSVSGTWTKGTIQDPAGSPVTIF